MIRPLCDVCGSELFAEGALIFAPPRLARVVKMHICVCCWPLTRDALKRLAKKPHKRRGGK